jgi:hypothetical protein
MKWFLISFHIPRDHQSQRFEYSSILAVPLAKVDRQLNAATGILSAIAGYLFGKATKGSDVEQKSDKALTP